MARAVRTNWRLKSMTNCPNSRGPARARTTSTRKTIPGRPTTTTRKSRQVRTSPWPPRRRHAAPRFCPTSICKSLSRSAGGAERRTSPPAVHRLVAEADAGVMRLVAVGHGIWIDEPGICRSRFDTVMCDTCVLSTPCVVCVGGSAIESMTRHPRQLPPSARCAPHRCRRSQRRSYLSTTISRKPDRSWARNHFSRLAQVARPRQRLAGSRSPASIIRMRSAATMCALVIAA